MVGDVTDQRFAHRVLADCVALLGVVLTGFVLLILLCDLVEIGGVESRRLERANRLKSNSNTPTTTYQIVV